MTTLAIAVKTLRQAYREPQLLAVALVCPVVLVLAYHVAFGPTERGLARHLHLLVLDQDVGVEMPGGEGWNAGEELVRSIEELRHDGKPVFTVHRIERADQGDVMLRERRATLRLSIPAGFSQALLAARTGAAFALPATVTVTGDVASDHGVLACGILEDLVRAYGGSPPRWGPSPDIRTEYLDREDSASDFGLGVTSAIVFGTLFLVITTATAVVRERTARTLDRLRLTRVRSHQLLGGVALGQLAVAAVQVPLVFGVALACGFRPAGSLGLAMVITGLLCVAAVGLGLLVACVARNDVDAVNFGSAVAVPVAFLSGSLLPMPGIPVFTAAGRTVEAFDFLPATHGVEAMRHVLLYGEGPAAIRYELLAMTTLTAVVFGAGVLLYQRLRLRLAGDDRA